MSSAILETTDSQRTSHPVAPGVRTAFRRLLKALPRNSRKPKWAHVPERAWRRHSALLTYMHEGQTGEH